MADTPNNTKVLVAMSGGVDSSVTAALLVAEGYDVTGAYMKQWSDTKDVSGVCTWREDRRDALRVAAHLGIELMTLDFEKEYKAWVMEYMFDEYTKGRTPNPDVLCNKYIKFGAWLDKAKELGFDYLATGHYASTDGTALLQAVDEGKDQTYFLHQLSQERLKHALFPLGKYTKSQVREMAQAQQLPTAHRAESMGICFVGEVPMKEFLLQKIKPTPGDIIHTNGNILGQHDGLAFYTIGQRNLNVKGEGNKPLFVVGKDFEKNQLVVGFEDDPLLYKKEVEVGETNWVSGQAPAFPLECEVRTRHRQSLQKAVITQGKTADAVSISFQHLQKAITPGQFAVVYKDGMCLGGGVIQ